jgi:predicted negative regulator of RcsB-dependent stress response
MAFDVLDEHEQGELVQKWLRENAVAIIAGIVLGLVLIFGWNQWKVHSAQKGAEAAAQFQALTDAATDGNVEDARKIGATLREEHPKSIYAALAALRAAEDAASRNDLATAASELDWARQRVPDGALAALVTLRSARVKLAQGEADAAIKLVDGLPKESYVASAGELRGDALLKLGRADEARRAYEGALATLDPQAPARGLLQMKLDDVGGATTAPVPVPSAAPEAEKKGS